MKTTVSERRGNTVRLDVEVSEDEVQQAIEDTIKRLAREVTLPGFRKGHVPRDLVVQRVGMDAIVRQMLDNNLAAWFGAAVEDVGIVPVGKPELEFGQVPQPGEPFAFATMMETMPEPELGPYKGVEVVKEKPAVSDEEVGAQVERLRNAFAELRTVLGRPIKEGDFVTADVAGSLEGEPVEWASAKDYVLEVGKSRLLPELEAALVGMHTGEEKKLEVTLPDEFEDEGLRGRTLDFSIVVREIKEKILPRLNDDFAKDVSEFATLLELRMDIRRKLQAAKEEAARRRSRNAAVRQAVDGAVISIPDVVIDEQVEDMLAELDQSLRRQASDLARYLHAAKLTEEQMRRDLRPRAELNVKTRLVLDAIAKREALEVPESEIDQWVSQVAAVEKMDPVELRSRLGQSGRITAVRQELLREKAADLIVAHAVAVAPESEAESAPEADPVGKLGAGD